ncbi:hypothetical protein GO491_09990 [Flavobacteriaceae bacterium Ap0902]|nr:hypothetical protein [Flavobacteriaceae bacterium Ap0902]
MSKNLEVLLSGKDFTRLEVLDDLFIVFSINKIDKLKLKKLLLSDFDDDLKIIRKISLIFGEFSLIRISFHEGIPKKISAFRSITSSFELFYCLNDTLYISNSFKNILSKKDISEREVSENALIDLFLYQRNFSQETYLKNVFRLGHGEYISYMNKTDIIKKQQIEKLELDSVFNLSKESSVLLDNLLETISTQLNNNHNAINTLSGGVDSSLIQSYLDNNKSISIAYDSPEFKNEIEYAKNASKLINTEHEFINLKEKDYLTNLIEASIILGQPSPDLPNIIIANELSKTSNNHFITSIYADSIFGLSQIKNLVKSNFNIGDLINKSVSDKYGYASMNFVIAQKDNLGYVEKIFGKEKIDFQLEKRSTYINNLLVNQKNTSITVYDHIEFGSLIGFYTNNLLSIFRQIGDHYNKSFSSPFLDQSILKTSLKIPLEERYYNTTFGTKPILKKILSNRVKSYDIYNPKLGGALPRTRFCIDGPLKDYFKRFEFPDFIDNSMKKEISNPTWENSWIVSYSIFYSIWVENVLKNNTLKLTKDTLVLKWKF